MHRMPAPKTPLLLLQFLLVVSLGALEVRYDVGYGFQATRSSVAVLDAMRTPTVDAGASSGLAALSFAYGSTEWGELCGQLAFSVPPAVSSSFDSPYSGPVMAIGQIGIGYEWAVVSSPHTTRWLGPTFAWESIRGSVERPGLAPGSNLPVAGGQPGLGLRGEVLWHPLDTGWALLDGWYIFASALAVADPLEFPKGWVQAVAGLGLTQE